MLINLWGEIFAPCNGTSTTHKYYCSDNTTNPYIIDWQILLPEGVRADYQQNKNKYLEMLTCKSRCLNSDSHRYYDEYKVNSVGNQIAYSSSIHAQMWNKYIVEQDG